MFYQTLKKVLADRKWDDGAVRVLLSVLSDTTLCVVLLSNRMLPKSFDDYLYALHDSL